MKLLLNNTEDRIRRWIEFEDVKSERTRLLVVNYLPDERERVLPFPELWDLRLKWSLENYQQAIERMNWLPDDSLPYLDMLTGTEIFGEAMGCKVHYPENERPFAMPYITDASQVSSIKVPVLSSSTLSVLFEKTDELIKLSGERKPLLRLPDIQSPMDIVALLWDKTDLYTAMILAPEAVKELSQKVYELLTAFFDEWTRRYGNGFIAHYPAYYMEKGISLSVDEIGTVDEEHFREFFLPELVKLSERYGGMGIHCCANSQHQWENFKLIPEVKMINICRPEAILIESFNSFAGHIPQYPYLTAAEPGQSSGLSGKMPSRAHIVIEMDAHTKMEAIEISAGFFTKEKSAAL